MGNNKDEGTFLVDAIPAEAYEILTFVYGSTIANGDPTDYIAYINEQMADKTPRDKMIRVWFDYFRASGLRAADASSQAGVGGWNYSLELPGNTPLGTAHSSDIAFTFNMLNHPDDMDFPVFHEATPANKELANIWSKTLATFARTGDPNGAGLPHWPQYDRTTRSTLVINAESKVVEDLDGAELRGIYGME